MEIWNLGSGSKGNATLIKSSTTSILIDAGLSYKQMLTRSKNDLKQILSVLITHEHSDHTLGLPILLKNLNVPVYLSEKSFGKMNEVYQKAIDKAYFITPKQRLLIGDIWVNVVQLFHDSIDCLGFVFECDNEKVVYITDTGYVHKDDYELIKNADAYFMESNHDIEMLMDSDRPYDLKLRIFGDHGHMSNIDASSLICYVCGIKTKQIVFGHLSDECNTPQKVLDTAKEVFESFGLSINNFEVYCANQIEPLLIEVK